MVHIPNDSPIEPAKPLLGVIGGSGAYHIRGLEETDEIEISTPFGPPSTPVVIGKLNGRSLAFITRHGRHHSIVPDKINFRANIYALKSLGVQEVIGISACGSLRQDYAPGELVVPDQLVDRSQNRAATFFDEDLVAHISVDEPFCPDLSSRLVHAAEKAGGKVHPRGTAITISGPRFSTKAETNIFRSWAVDIIGMTTAPEAFLAREAEMCYAVLAHITDYDVWLAGVDPVTASYIQDRLRQNVNLIHRVLQEFTRQNDPAGHCSCPEALETAMSSPFRHVSPQTLEKLSPLIDKYYQQGED